MMKTLLTFLKTSMSHQSTSGSVFATSLESVKSLEDNIVKLEGRCACSPSYKCFHRHYVKNK